jgi:hypothetical protein
VYYNVIGNDMRECLKNTDIGQSAAKGLRNEFKVQRLDQVVYNESHDERSTSAEVLNFSVNAINNHTYHRDGECMIKND